VLVGYRVIVRFWSLLRFMWNQYH